MKVVVQEISLLLILYFTLMNERNLFDDMVKAYFSKFGRKSAEHIREAT